MIRINEYIIIHLLYEVNYLNNVRRNLEQSTACLLQY